MKTFSQYYFGIITRPNDTFSQLLADEKRFRYGWYAILLNMFLYTWVYVNLTIGGGAPSSFTPWLSIPKESYYFYDQFLLAPSMLICWISAAGIIYLLSKPFGGTGSFDDTLSVLGFSISISCLASLLHDLPDTFLGAIGLLDLRQYEIALNSPTIWRTILWICYGSSLVLFVLLFWRAVKITHKINNTAAFFIGLLGFVTYQTLFLVFNR